MWSKLSFMLHLWLGIYFFFKRNRKCNQQKLRVCKAFSKIIACKTSDAALLFWNNCFWKDWYLLTCKHWWSPRVHSHGEAERNQMSAAQVVAPPLTKIAAWFMNQLLYCCCSQLSIAFKVDLCTSKQAWDVQMFFGCVFRLAAVALAIPIRAVVTALEAWF